MGEKQYGHHRCLRLFSTVYLLALFWLETHEKNSRKPYHGETQYLSMANHIAKEILVIVILNTFPRFGGSFPKGGPFKSWEPFLPGKTSFISRSSDDIWILITYSYQEERNDMLDYVQVIRCYYGYWSLVTEKINDDQNNNFSWI